ncbi:hypothetical protein IGX29_20285, partial [Streptomyces sp. H28]|nr:hypothetical protein [Streptomyces sp. H28]
MTARLVAAGAPEDHVAPLRHARGRALPGLGRAEAVPGSDPTTYVAVRAT